MIERRFLPMHMNLHPSQVTEIHFLPIRMSIHPLNPMVMIHFLRMHLSFLDILLAGINLAMQQKRTIQLGLNLATQQTINIMRQHTPLKILIRLFQVLVFARKLRGRKIKNRTALDQVRHPVNVEDNYSLLVDYMSIGNPKGYFKVGRIFKTDLPDSQDLTLVVVGEGSDSAISCVPIKQAAGEEEFPIIRENPSVSIESSLPLDFARQYKVEPSSKVLNIGRIDRNYLKTLKARSQTETGGGPTSINTLEDSHAGQSAGGGGAESFYTARSGSSYAQQSNSRGIRSGVKVITTNNPSTAFELLDKGKKKIMHLSYLC